MSCPVCFNAAAADDVVRTSLNTGIFVLLGVTACVLAGFMRFIVSIARRSRSAGSPPAVAEPKVSFPDQLKSPAIKAGFQARVEA